MKITTTIIAIMGALTLGNRGTAYAQTAATADGGMFVNISLGGQFQSREFSSITTFELFNETGSVTANQTVGNGFVFDITGGYRIWQNVAVAVGVSTSNGSGEAAALAAIPNPLFVGTPTLISFPPEAYGDLKQSTVAFNFQIVWMSSLTDRLDLAVFGGPSIIRVRQEFASATAEENSVPLIQTETELTPKAGTVGIDLSYRLTDRYGVGGFVRYAAAQADFVPAPDLQVGGTQAGGGIRIRF